jgi:hypothetical protein
MPDTGSATPSHGRSVVLSHIRDCQFTVNHQTLHAHAAAERLQQRRANPIRLLREFEAQWQDATMIAFLLATVATSERSGPRTDHRGALVPR